jgi:predicted anti-sigma-YlaC factor YlaD
MSHLGRRLSALIDGELGDAERDQAHAHLVSCEACRAEAAALRTLKRRMRGLGEAPADNALTRRLIALEGLPEVAPPRSRVPGAARARAALSAFSGATTGGRSGWDGFSDDLGMSPLAADAAGPGVSAAVAVSPLSPGRSRQHTRFLVAGAVAALAVGLGAASFAAGGVEPHLPGPMITPEVDSFNIQHAATFGQLPTLPSAVPTAVPPAVPSAAIPVPTVKQTAGSLQP